MASLSRRDFLKVMSIGTVGTSAAVLAACGSETSETGDSAETTIQAGEQTSSGKDTTTVTAADGSEVVTVAVDESKKVHDIIQTTTRETTTWNLFNAAGKPGIPVNFIDPLLTVDSKNQLIPCLAESYSSNEDETVWTFNIRKGVTWVDSNGEYKDDVVAEDWLWGLEWTLNFWKNDSANTTLPVSVLKGAREYYEYTQALSEEEAFALGIDKFQEMVGISCPDDYTVQYEMMTSCPYFGSMATCVFLYPLAKGQLEEAGVTGYKAVTPFTLWYNGPYLMSEFVEDSTKTMVPNPTYWDDTVDRFDSVTWLKVESTDVDWQLFEMGNINLPNVSNAQQSIIRNDPTNQWNGYLVKKPDTGVAWFFAFNFAKKNLDDTIDEQWNKCAANENFRQCFYWGMDLYNYMATAWDAKDPTSAARGTMTVYGLCKLSDGRDYTDLVYDAIDFHPTENWSHCDPDKLATYKAAAVEELTAEGVTFPVHMDLWSSSTQSNVDTYTVIKETLEDCLGTDFVEVEIHTYVTSKTSEVYNPSYMSFEPQGYGALYADPMTFLTQLCDDMDGNAEYSDMYGHIADCTEEEPVAMLREFTEKVRAADAIVGDHDARYEALAEAEAWAIQHALIFPTVTNASRIITLVNEYSKPAAINDSQSGRCVNWETNSDYYTEEEYEIIRKAYLAVSGTTEHNG